MHSLRLHLRSISPFSIGRKGNVLHGSHHAIDSGLDYHGWIACIKPWTVSFELNTEGSKSWSAQSCALKAWGQWVVNTVDRNRNNKNISSSLTHWAGNCIYFHHLTQTNPSAYTPSSSISSISWRARGSPTLKSAALASSWTPISSSSANASIKPSIAPA